MKRRLILGKEKTEIEVKVHEAKFKKGEVLGQTEYSFK